MVSSKEYNEKYYNKNREKIIERSKQYSKDNKEKMKEYHKKYGKQYYKKNKIYLLNKSKVYYTNNKSDRLIYLKRFRENNPKTIKEQKREYWLRNGDKIKQRKNERRNYLGLPLMGIKQHYNETKLFVYISSLFKSEEIIRNSRSFLDGLQLDIFIPSLKVAFEYQGCQHFIYPNYYHKTKEEFELQQFRDNRKKELCNKNGIILVEITCFEELSLQLILKKLKENKILVKTQTELKPHFI